MLYVVSQVDVLQELYPQIKENDIFILQQLIRNFSRTLSRVESCGALPDPKKFSKHQWSFLGSIVGESMSIKRGAYSMNEYFDIFYDVTKDETADFIEVDTILYNTVECK